MANFNENTERAVEQTEQVIEQTMNQTGEAMDQYFNFVQRAFSSFPFGSPELTEKMKRFTQINLAEAENFARNLSQAKDFQDAVRIQTEYMQNQFHAFGEQTRSLTEAFTQSATGVVKNPFRNY